jgi:hypothetical protein
MKRKLELDNDYEKLFNIIKMMREIIMELNLNIKEII